MPLRFTLQLAIVFSFILCPAFGSAQAPVSDSLATVIVRTTDGNEFLGKIRSQDSTRLVLVTANFGEIQLELAAIRSIQVLENSPSIENRGWLPSPYLNRHYVSQNAYGMRKGEGFYENAWLFLNQFSYGFSDQFSMRLGFSPLILADLPLPFWVETKLSIPLQRERLNLALGSFLGYRFSDSGDDGNFGAMYSQLTLGSREANLTAGLGLGFSNGNWSNKPIFSLAGAHRTGRKLALISENYFFQVDGDVFSVLSAGCRFMGRSVAIDGALVLVSVKHSGVFPIPWIGLQVPFGRAAKY